MAARHLLYFTGERQLVFRAAGAGLRLEATFGGDEENIAAFRGMLRQRRGALFGVVADLVGEDFHEEQIPWLRGSDRQAVIQRRLAQRYRDTRLAAALSLGQVVTPERRNERLLLASFTNTHQLAPWLDALEESDTRLAGVYSVPLLAPALAAALGIRAGRCLVVTPHQAGLRQSFVEDGRLRFARLERTTELRPAALAEFVRSETHRLAQYLTALRALPREGAPVQVMVVAPPGQAALFEQALVSDARLLFSTVDLESAASRIRLRGRPAQVGAEALYLHLAARKPPREQFATRDDRRRFFLWRLQRGIVAAGAAGLAACALFAGVQWLEAFAADEAAAAQRRQAQVATQHYEGITAAFPVTQTSTDNLKAAVIEFRRIADQSDSPETALMHLSQVLDRFPQFEIDRIVWRADEPGKPVPASEPGVQLEISGRVNATQRDDYRGITAQVQRFAGELGHAGYRLVRTQLPFDITPEGTLTGDIGIATAAGQAPHFTVVLARRLP